MDWAIDFVDDAKAWLSKFPWLMAASLFLYLTAIGGAIAGFLFEGQYVPWLAVAVCALTLNRVEVLIYRLRMTQ